MQVWSGITGRTTLWQVAVHMNRNLTHLSPRCSKFSPSSPPQPLLLHSIGDQLGTRNGATGVPKRVEITHSDYVANLL